MATIPMGNFGQTVARPGPSVQVQRGDPIGDAGQRFGRMAGDIVGDAQMQQQRLQQRDLAEQQRKDEQAREAAIRAQTITTLTGTKDKLADLHDEIAQGVLDGSVPKDKAETTFRDRATKAMEGIGADLPEYQRATVLAELNSDAGKLGNSVRKVVTQRDRQDVTAGITQTLEYLQREFRSDPAKATQRAADVVDQLGPHSTLSPDQLAKLKQGWKEKTQFTAGYELVSAGRNDRRSLDSAERAIAQGLPDIDPQQRATLMDRIAAYRLHLDQKAEVAAQRAAREEERRMRKAEAEFSAFQALSDKGTMLDPSYIDRTLAATAGTPYQAGIKALAQNARDVGGLAASPVRVQQATLDALDAEIAKNGRSPELDKRRGAVEKVLRGSRTDLESDPLRAGLERGVITDLRPLDPSGGLPGTIQQLRERLPAAERVAVWAGRPVSPATAEEAAMLHQQIAALPAKERSGAVAALAQSLGPQAAQGLAAQMDKKDRAMALAFALAGEQTTAGRYTSELVIRGAQAKLDGTSTKGEKQPEVKAAQWSAHIASALDGVFAQQTTTDQIRDAAVLIAHGLASESGGALRSKDLDKAVSLALGGTLVEHNGRKIPLPAGVDEDALDKRLRSISADELAKQAPGGTVRAGGAAMPVAEFVKMLPGQQLMPVKPGKFAVLVGGRPVVNAEGRPIIVGVR